MWGGYARYPAPRPTPYNLASGRDAMTSHPLYLGRVEHPCSTARPTKDGQPYQTPATRHLGLPPATRSFVFHFCTFARG